MNRQYPQYKTPNLAFLIGKHITWSCDDTDLPTKQPGYIRWWDRSGIIIDANNTGVIVQIDDENVTEYLDCGILTSKAHERCIRALMMRCLVGPSHRRLLDDHTSYEVYKLIDPRNDETFYVGMSKNAAIRHKQHINSKSKCPRKDKRIEDIKTSGQLPILKIIGHSEGKFQALMHEEYWIQYYIEQGINLTNYENRVEVGDE